MTLVFTAPTLFIVIHLRNLLEAAGIASEVRNEFLASGAGELPPTETWPELWVDDGNAERAGTIIAEFTREGGLPAGPSWRCSTCGEENEGNFGQCWRCGTLRDSQSP